LIESNITAWRRAVCGDLTSAFNFATPNEDPVELPDTSAYEPPSHDRHADYVPVPPTNQSLPSQERGVRRARALPYNLQADGTAQVADQTFRIDFENRGDAGACFQVRSDSATDGPWTYTVEAHKSLSNSWQLAQTQGKYDLSVFGPNGFFRRFRGTAARTSTVDLDMDVSYDVGDNVLVVRITNQALGSSQVRVKSAYDDRSVVDQLPGGRALELRWPLKSSFGWYDLTITADADPDFLRRLAGHLENGQDSVSDPAFGQPGSS
jgi:phospholipase C